MSEELKGEIGSSGVQYDVGVDDQLNVSIGIAAVAQGGVMAGSSVGVQAKIPLVAILDAAAAASKNSTVIAVEGWLKALLLQYEAGKAPASVEAPVQS